MKIQLNGQVHEVHKDIVLSELLEGLGLNRDGVAVAVDQQVVPRSHHPQHALHEGAKVEVIRAVGGG